MTGAAHPLSATVAALHAEGLCDAGIAARLGCDRSWVGRLRRGLGLPARRRVPLVGPALRGRIAALWRKGLADPEIAARLGLHRVTVARHRSAMGLPGRRDVICRGEVRRLNLAGLTDAEIGARLGRSARHVGDLRRAMGLPSRGKFRVSEALLGRLTPAQRADFEFLRQRQDFSAPRAFGAVGRADLVHELRHGVVR